MNRLLDWLIDRIPAGARYWLADLLRDLVDGFDDTAGY